MDTNGTNYKRIMRHAREPDWSDQIVYARVEWLEGEQRIDLIGRLWIMDVDGKDKRQLTGR